MGAGAKPTSTPRSSQENVRRLYQSSPFGRTLSPDGNGAPAPVQPVKAESLLADSLAREKAVNSPTHQR